MANATITASAAEQTVQENNDAIVTFLLTDASGTPTSLTSSTTVRVSVNPQGGATTADYGPAGALSYHMGHGVGGWLPVTGGVITINAGFTDFQLKTNITNDTITEGYDSLAFTVAQTTSSVGLENSWWVPSLVNLLDAVGTGTAALTRKITADTSSKAVEGSADWNIGTPGIASYHLSNSGAAYSTTEVRVSMYGLGGAISTDYSGFRFRTTTDNGTNWTAWATAVNNGTIEIGRNVTDFQLASLAVTDTYAETGEGISFNVAQTTSSVGLVDSWWVPNVVDLEDAPGTGAVALTRKITAPADPIPGMEGAVDWSGGAASKPAIAEFEVSGGGSTAYALTTEVRVSMYGTGGAIPADYSGFRFRTTIDNGTNWTAWTPATNNGTIDIGRYVTDFQLGSYAVTDTYAETGEAISFTVAQTTSSVGLIDSWWVQSTAGLSDVTSIYTTVTGAVGPDHFAGTSGHDMFVIPHGTSKAFADGATGLPGIAGDTGAFNSGELFDTITGFAAGTDRIDLTNTVTSLALKGTAATEEALLNILNGPGFNVFLGPGVVGYYTVTPAGWPANVYFLVDANGDNGWYPGVDTFIKIVGGGSVTTADFV